MIERKVSKEKYLFAFFVTVCIFGLGLLLGFVIENKRIESMQSRYERQSLEFSSLQLQYEFVDEFNKEQNCGAISNALAESIKNLERTRERIESYKQDSTFLQGEFSMLKREYTLAQIKYWLLIRKTKSICTEKYSTIIYFFGPPELCGDCEKQSFVLTYLKQKFGNQLLNFIFDGSFEDEPMINILKGAYDVTIYPTIIINDKKYEGFVSTENVLKELCNSGSSDICENGT